LEVRPDRQARHEEFSSSVRDERTIAPGFTSCQGALLLQSLGMARRAEPPGFAGERQ
jgi:hypothetical protein